MPALSSSVPTLTLAGAEAVVAAARARADSLGLGVCICVTDRSGGPIMTIRMDDAPLLSAGIAADKAFTVASFKGLPTDAWWGAIENEPALVHGITHTPRLTIFGGGKPILVGGVLAGAIGVSGGSADQDVEIAAAGAAAIS